MPLLPLLVAGGILPVPALGHPAPPPGAGVGQADEQTCAIRIGALLHAVKPGGTHQVHSDSPTTELITSELVTNAIHHARPPVKLRLIRQETGLTCEVSDGSSTSPHLLGLTSRAAATAGEAGL